MRQHMEDHPDFAKILAEKIKTEFGKVSEKLAEMTWDVEESGVTSDDVDQAMLSFL